MNFEEFQRLLHEEDTNDTDDRYTNIYNDEKKYSSKQTTSDNISSFLDDVQKRYQSLIEDLDTINVLILLIYFIIIETTRYK